MLCFSIKGTSFQIVFLIILVKFKFDRKIARTKSLTEGVGSTSLISCGQNHGVRTILGREFAEVELEQSLTEKSLHNVIDDKKEIISDSTIAVSVAEAILFKAYGKENIKDQRPYEIYKIKNYWSISGTLPRGTLGGTFLIIIDAKDGRIIRITHGK